MEAGAGEGGDEDARGGKGVGMERSYEGEDMLDGSYYSRRGRAECYVLLMRIFREY